MVVLVLTACPIGLRGYLTRWLLEISPGVFTGHVSTRVRDLLWDNTVEMVKDGRAIMVYNTRNEQRLQFRVHHHDWVPTDFDGVQLMMRPNRDDSAPRSNSKQPHGWSNQAKWRMGRRHAGPTK
ncbi:MAG: type I-E CRISPR-associated endoribonuclease Cas2e [Propionibacteriaceae bacterium]|jgi:CRISPR-associated protein Cas2|nr:type I-E CRISPR-associated endoribonuclease Cas2e [Propionibacteriaceae bacterium]